MSKTLEIVLVEHEGEKVLHVKAVNADRLTHYGFGTFLENVDPTEIAITDDARDILLSQPERSGLQGLEFWPDFRMAWGTPNDEIYVRPHDVNVPPAARAWIEKMSVKEAA